MPWNTFDAENTQMAGKVCAPQKWPPARTIEMFSNCVGGVGAEAVHRVAEVQRADRDARVDQGVGDADVAEGVVVAAVDGDAGRPPGERRRQVLVDVVRSRRRRRRRSAENRAKLSSPVARASLLTTWLSVLPLVMLMPSANVSRIREFCDRHAGRCWRPSTGTTMCSTQMLSIVTLRDVGEVEHLARAVDPGRVVAEVRRSPRTSSRWRVPAARKPTSVFSTAWTARRTG